MGFKMMRMKKLTVLSIYTCLTLTSSVLMAQSSSSIQLPTAPEALGTSAVSGTSTTQINPIKKEEKPLTIELGIEMGEKVSKEEFTPKKNTLGILIAPAYKINETFKASGKITINQDNYAQHETTASDGTLSLAINGFKLSEHLKTTHSLGTIIPVSEKSVKTDRLQGSISARNGIKYSSDYFDLSYKLGLTRFFHEFKQNAEGSPNIQYRLSQLIELKAPIFTEKLAITTSLDYRIGRTYRDFERFGFIYDADLNYDLTDKLSANIGTTNDGSALKYNGVDSNIQAYNENTSVYRLGITYTY